MEVHDGNYDSIVAAEDVAFENKKAARKAVETAADAQYAASKKLDEVRKDPDATDEDKANAKQEYDDAEF